jgi:hypothetical protein
MKKLMIAVVTGLLMASAGAAMAATSAPQSQTQQAAARQTGMYAPSPYDVNQFGGN